MVYRNVFLFMSFGLNAEQILYRENIRELQGNLMYLWCVCVCGLECAYVLAGIGVSVRAHRNSLN